MVLLPNTDHKQIMASRYWHHDSINLEDEAFLMHERVTAELPPIRPQNHRRTRGSRSGGGSICVLACRLFRPFILLPTSFPLSSFVPIFRIPFFLRPCPLHGSVASVPVSPTIASISRYRGIIPLLQSISIYSYQVLLYPLSLV